MNIMKDFRSYLVLQKEGRIPLRQINNADDPDAKRIALRFAKNHELETGYAVQVIESKHDPKYKSTMSATGQMSYPVMQNEEIRLTKPRKRTGSRHK